MEFQSNRHRQGAISLLLFAWLFGCGVSFGGYEEFIDLLEGSPNSVDVVLLKSAGIGKSKTVEHRLDVENVTTLFRLLKSSFVISTPSAGSLYDIYYLRLIKGTASGSPSEWNIECRFRRDDKVVWIRVTKGVLPPFNCSLNQEDSQKLEEFLQSLVPVVFQKS